MKQSYFDKPEFEGDITKTPPTTTNDDKGNLKNFIKQEAMISILNKKGITKLFPIQYETFQIIQNNEDVVAKDRTGSGKTMAYALPTIMRMRNQSKFRGKHTTKFLIVLPTRQLAIQVKEEISSLRLRDQEDFTCAAFYGGSSIQEQLDILYRGVDIVIGTPGRLIDFLNRGAIKLNELQSICLDEADEMLKIGFKDDIQKIFQNITKAKSSKIQCLLFSATIPSWIWEISDKYQSKNKKFIDMIKDSNVRTSKTVEHYCLKASPMQKQAYIGSLIKYFLKGKVGKVIIFCETKREVERIANSGLIPYSIQMLHGDIRQYQRQRVFRKFKKGQIQCLVATNVAARGLDFPEIDLIVQMQPPNNTETYIHRSGRTGRAGKAGICATLFSFKEEHLMKRIESETKIILHNINCRDLKPTSASEVKSTQQSHNYKENNEHRSSSHRDSTSDYKSSRSESKYEPRDRKPDIREERNGRRQSKPTDDLEY